MAVTIHQGGPADGMRVRVEGTPPQTRFYLPAQQRQSSGWLDVARYVYVPPRDGPRAVYRYTGVHQVQGPLPGGAGGPDWS